MQYSLGRDFRINFGDYEGTNVNGHVVIKHTDLGYTDQQWSEHVKEVGYAAAFEELKAVADECLIKGMVDEFVENEPYILDPKKSFVPQWLERNLSPEPKKRGS